MKRNNLIVFTILLLAIVFVSISNGQTNNSSNSSEKQKEKNQQQEKNRPVKIESKTPAKRANCSQSSGVVTLIVTFDKSAKVTKTEIFKSSGCDSFDQNAVKATREIKFQPAIKNGDPVTISKPVRYSFRQY